MPYININTGSFDNDPSADKIRVAFNKSKSMFAELYTMFGDIVFDLDGVGVANVVQIPYNPIDNDHTEAENIANSINNCPFVIDVPQGQLIFVRCVIGNAGQTPGVISFVTVTYMILNGSGTYGTMQPQIPPDRVLKIEQEITSETNNYDLGDIGGADIWDYVNFNGPYAVSGTTTFTTSDKVYVFVGAEGLYGVDNLQTTSANFIEITESAVVSNSDLPPKQISVDTYNLPDSDLYRQLYFTEENTQLTIPDAYTSPNASYYFRVFFAGSGTHSIVDVEGSETYNFEQGDYVLCEKKFGTNGWIIKKVGGGSSLKVTDGDEEEVEDVNQINFIGATVTDNEDGSVDVEFENITLTAPAQNRKIESDGTGNLIDLDEWLDAHADAEATSPYGDVTWSYSCSELIEGDVKGKAIGTYLASFTATDEVGNSITTTAALKLEDTTPPLIMDEAENLTGDMPTFVGWLNNNGGALASDSAGTITWTNDFTEFNEGSATVIFTATDECGNSSTTNATFTLEEFSLTITDNDEESVSNVDTINFIGATVTDNEDGSVDVEFTSEGVEWDAITGDQGDIDVSGFNNDAGYTSNTGTVTSVNASVPTGFTVGSPVTSSGNIAISYDTGYVGYTTTEASKLSGIAENANNYTHPNHSGDVTSDGDGATTIANNVVGNTKLATVASGIIKGRVTAGTGNVEDLSASQVRTLLNVEDGAEVNVQSDWDAESGDAQILNKPTIPSPLTVDDGDEEVNNVSKINFAGATVTDDDDGEITVTIPEVSLDDAYNGGRTIDADAGAVLINTDGIDVRGAISSGATVETVGGTITRMLFNPRKGAFRAGGTNSTIYWNDAGLGEHSIGLGLNAFASGNHSVSIGRQNIVNVDEGVTIGTLNEQTASGLTIGLQNTLVFGNSVLIGRLNTNNFAESIILGISNVTNGYGAIAVGLNNQPQSLYEIALGSFGTIYSRTAVNGFTWHDADRLLNIGNGQNTSSRSDAFTILKSGLAILPSVDNNKIDAGSGKSIVTKEYLEAKYPVEIKRVKVTIPAEEMRTCDSSPVILIPAQGSNTVIVVTNVSLLMDYQSENYNFAASLKLVLPATISEIPLTFINNAVSYGSLTVLLGGIGGILQTNVENEPLLLQSFDGNATTGDSPVTFIIDYTVHDFN